jgi:TolA-binding protein
MSNIVLKQAEEFTITTSNDLTAGSDILSQLNKMKDSIEAEKVKVTRPLLDALNAERARWKPQELKLDTLITKIRKMITDYQTEQVRLQRIEQEAIAKKLADGKIKPETAIKKMEAVAEPEHKIETVNGSISFKTVTRFEIEDHKAIPVEFLLLNEVLVREALKNGKKLVGIRYWEEQIPINKR